MNTDFRTDFDKVVAEKLVKGKEYAKAKSRSWQMQKLEGHILAVKQKEFIASGMPVTRAEVEAKASPEYKTHIDGTSHAIEIEHTNKAEYDNLDSHFEELRSLCSLEKKTMGFVD